MDNDRYQKERAGVIVPRIRDSAPPLIQEKYVSFDGVRRRVSRATVIAIAEALGVSAVTRLGDRPEKRVTRKCFVPPELRRFSTWGVTCQLASLVSTRNAGIGDFADLATLSRIAAHHGADFVGVNPLHALFWNDPTRVSPFSPSDRRLLNPMYIALDWIEGFQGFTSTEVVEVARLRTSSVVKIEAVASFKNRVLRRLFAAAEPFRGELTEFLEAGGDTLLRHAAFEAISEEMVAHGHAATPPGWPTALRRFSPGAIEFAKRRNRGMDFYIWLQWIAHRQLRRVCEEARTAGLRLGLYLDFAVGVATDGSSTWDDEAHNVSNLSIGAPPDPFNSAGQDWGLSPCSPLHLASTQGEPFTQDLAAVMRFSGATRIDHVMSLSRLWLIPLGASPTDGAYVRYPTHTLLNRLAETSQKFECVVIGEDLGVVPRGLRALMTRHAVHRYLVLFFERKRGRISDPRSWPAEALACLGTHDMPTVASWWNGSDIELRHSLGLLTSADVEIARTERERDRQTLLEGFSNRSEEAPLLVSVYLHRRVAASRCRLMVLQLEDALGLDTQVNVPGTVTEYPNWLKKLPVSLERLADEAAFSLHTAAISNARMH